jgi:membrane associated rhomboid family serine protease
MQRNITFAAWPLTRAVKIILIINAAVWLVTVLLSKVSNGNFLYLNLALTPHAVFPEFHIWQPFTYMWLHDIRGFSHILFNSLCLWMFGGALEQDWGTKRFVKFYLICGVGAGLVVFLTGMLFDPYAPVVGASGAIYGLIAAWAIINPNRQIYIFGVFPIKAKIFVMIPIGYALLDFIVGGSGISHSAHLGGLAIGALYSSGYWHPSRIINRLHYWFLEKKLKTLEKETKGTHQKKSTEKKPPGGGYWN